MLPDQQLSPALGIEARTTISLGAAADRGGQFLEPCLREKVCVCVRG